MTVERLLHALADGRTHSGEELARAFGVTRAAITYAVRNNLLQAIYVAGRPHLTESEVTKYKNLASPQRRRGT